MPIGAGCHGSLYPALHRMQKRGWVTSKWGPSEDNRKARFYSITVRGRTCPGRLLPRV